MEPVTDIVLNIKGVIPFPFSVPKTVYIKVDKKGEIRARNIICDERRGRQSRSSYRDLDLDILFNMG